MDLRQLNAVVAVADHGSFSAAARALHTVQSNISAHVARLEAELDVVVIDRATRRPTREGGAVVARARRVQAELAALEADVEALHREVSGSVRLGSIGTTGRWLVPRLFDAMADAFPAVELIVVDATTTSLLPQIATGQIDLAVINLPIDRDNRAEVVADPLFTEDRVVLAPAGHPLAEHTTVTLAELARYELLIEPPGTAFRDELDAEARRVGVKLRTRAQVDGMRLLGSLAAEGLAPAVLPATATAAFGEGPHRVVSVDDLAPRSVGLARPRRGLLSAPGRAVRDLVQNIVETQIPHLEGVHASP